MNVPDLQVRLGNKKTLAYPRLVCSPTCGACERHGDLGFSGQSERSRFCGALVPMQYVFASQTFLQGEACFFNGSHDYPARFNSDESGVALPC